MAALLRNQVRISGTVACDVRTGIRLWRGRGDPPVWEYTTKYVHRGSTAVCWSFPGIPVQFSCRPVYGPTVVLQG